MDGIAKLDDEDLVRELIFYGECQSAQEFRNLFRNLKFVYMIYMLYV
jgi:hypothetical protein